MEESFDDFLKERGLYVFSDSEKTICDNSSFSNKWTLHLTKRFASQLKIPKTMSMKVFVQEKPCGLLAKIQIEQLLDLEARHNGGSPIVWLDKTLLPRYKTVFGFASFERIKKEFSSAIKIDQTIVITTEDWWLLERMLSRKQTINPSREKIHRIKQLEKAKKIMEKLKPEDLDSFLGQESL